MQQHPLVVPSILDHAARWHGEQEVVSVSVEGEVERSTYRQLAERARLAALALRRLGIRCARLWWCAREGVNATLQAVLRRLLGTTKCP